MRLRNRQPDEPAPQPVPFELKPAAPRRVAVEPLPERGEETDEAARGLEASVMAALGRVQLTLELLERRLQRLEEKAGLDGAVPSRPVIARDGSISRLRTRTAEAGLDGSDAMPVSDG